MVEGTIYKIKRAPSEGDLAGRPLGWLVGMRETLRATCQEVVLSIYSIAINGGEKAFLYYQLRSVLVFLCESG